MQQRKSKKILIYFFLLLIFGSLNNVNFTKNEFTQINKIKVSGLDNIHDKNILLKIKDLNLENIFFLDSKEFKQILNQNTLIEKYKIFKIYPSTIEIQLKKTDFLAKINKNGKEYFVGSNGKFSKSDHLSFELPYIFGNPEISDFFSFKKIIDDSKISYEQIKNLYFFKSKRWDIELKDDVLIKLPRKHIKEALHSIYKILDDRNIKSFKIIDARVKNQIILND